MGLFVLVALGIALSGFTMLMLKYWKGDRFLCDNCRFNQPELCFKAERPTALICHSYRQVD